MDGVMYEEVHRRAGIERELASRVDQKVDEYHMNRKVLMADVGGGRVRSRPRIGWMDVIKVALGSRRMAVEGARQCAKDRMEWRAPVYM